MWWMLALWRCANITEATVCSRQAMTPSGDPQSASDPSNHHSQNLFKLDVILTGQFKIRALNFRSWFDFICLREFTCFQKARTSHCNSDWEYIKITTLHKLPLIDNLREKRNCMLQIQWLKTLWLEKNFISRKSSYSLSVLVKSL